MLTDFQTSFTGRLSSKFLTRNDKISQPHPKCVATLPCEILMSDKTATTGNVGLLWLTIHDMVVEQRDVDVMRPLHITFLYIY